MTGTSIYDRQFVISLKNLLLYEKDHQVRNGLYDITQAMISYHSNRIEGSPLSYDDTWELYDKGTISIGSVRAQDISDAQGHFLMFDKMLETLDQPIDKKLICEYHMSLKEGSYIDKKRNFAIGKYKQLNNSIGGIIQTTSVEDVENEMEDFFKRYYDIAEIGHNLNTLSKSHAVFERIHPFQDGNGRVGRMLLFRECLDAGIVPVLITEDLSKDYKNSLRNYSLGQEDISSLVTVFEKASVNYLQLSKRYVHEYNRQFTNIKREDILNDIDEQIHLITENLSRQTSDPYGLSGSDSNKYLDYQEKHYQLLKTLFSEAIQLGLSGENIKEHCNDIILQIQESSQNMHNISVVTSIIDKKISLIIQETQDSQTTNSRNVIGNSFDTH